MNRCVVGLQWGDEGKGKVVDILAQQSDIVVRFNGGANAGHTVVVGDQRFALHLLPSGAVRAGTTCVIGNGVVVDPAVLLEEIEMLSQRGISLDNRLLISENAHVVLDYHKTEDRLREEALGKNKIGTTARGIGPCYADKVTRSQAVRMADLRYPDILREKLRNIVDYKNTLFTAVYKASVMDFDELFERCRIYSPRLAAYITDTTRFLHESVRQGKNILFEGAQGSLLDLDHGTYPYVTSSSCSALGMGVGCGVPAQKVARFIGVVKAYTTRVGNGPFPTEQNNDIGQLIRDKGHEYGTTTGRPRRCGWFDGVAARYSVSLGAIDEIAMMHLDTLTGFEKLQVCRAYKIDGVETDFFPSDAARLSRVECVYEIASGWEEDISAVQSFESLPRQAREYVNLVETVVGVPVTMIGVGPNRKQTIFRE